MDLHLCGLPGAQELTGEFPASPLRRAVSSERSAAPAGPDQSFSIVNAMVTGSVWAVSSVRLPLPARPRVFT